MNTNLRSRPKPRCQWLLLLLILLTPQPAGIKAQDDGKPAGDDLFLFPPNTPSRQIRGAILAERMNRTDLARKYLNELINSQPPAEELLRLRQEFGIGQFLKLSAIRDLQPPSRELLRLINSATQQETLSASTVEVLISELGQSEEQTLRASLKILSAEDAAVAPLLAADPATPEGELAGLLLQKYARRFRFGLLAELPNADDAGQERILKLLSRTSDRSLASDLLPYRFSDSPAVAASATEACTRLSGGTDLPTSPEQTANEMIRESLSLLSFAARPFPSSSDRRELQARRKSSGIPMDAAFGAASLNRAAQLARLAAGLAPEQAGAAQLVTETTEQLWPLRWPNSFALPVSTNEPSEATDADTAAMQLALDSNNPAAVLAMLARTDAAVSVLTDEPPLLRRCTFQTDPRVRLAASAFHNAIAGATTRTSQAIQNTVRGSSKPEAVVIDSRSGQGRDTAAVLTEAGYVTVSRTSGQSGFEAAAGQLCCELILVHSNCLKWSLSTTITNLRNDYRTKNTPIVIYGPERDRAATETTRTRYSGIWFLTEPLSEITFEDAARLAGIPGPLLSEEERKQMIVFARSLE